METYSLIGHQDPFQFKWIFPILSLCLIPFSKYLAGRILPISVAVPFFGFAVACLGIPEPFYFFIEALPIIGVMARLGFLFLRRKSVKNPLMFLPAACALVPMFIFPSLLILQGSLANGGEVAMNQDNLTIFKRFRTNVLPRGKIDITYENAWLGGGLYWGFYADKENGNIIDSGETYWSGHWFISGDEVARRIASWSGSKPRLVVNGVGDRHWHNPHPNK